MLSRISRSFATNQTLLRSATTSRCWASTLVLSEPLNESITPAQTQSTVTAARSFGQDIELLVVGNDAPTEIPEGVTKVYHVALGDRLAESVALAIESVATANDCSVVLGASTKFGSTVIPRAAALLDVSPITDILEIQDESESPTTTILSCELVGQEDLISTQDFIPHTYFFVRINFEKSTYASSDTFVRPMYAGNVLCKVAIKDPTKRKVLSVRPTSFDKAPLTAVGEVVSVEVEPFTKAEWVSESVSKSDRPDLQSASTVVSGGRGIKSGDNFIILEKLADKLNAAVGASRAAVDAGFCPNDWQVGQTGKVVAPDLYIAAGISGAIQHLSGMKDSKCIVAINTDAEAPIFQVADYGLNQDLFEAVPELTDKL
ncbi:unnamed protein product [Cylindrotheca closterium]|uniref:Electron transfer flavoprotein subunit alpha n=1 Tax=Cylindrotheca closterium TaxID=2856 RepID=A0AAD2JHT9_9STRA|nr:unnamed protein product [Cylindrotheca closterium]